MSRAIQNPTGTANKGAWITDTAAECIHGSLKETRFNPPAMTKFVSVNLPSAQIAARSFSRQMVSRGIGCAIDMVILPKFQSRANGAIAIAQLPIQKAPVSNGSRDSDPAAAQSNKSTELTNAAGVRLCASFRIRAFALKAIYWAVACSRFLAFKVVRKTSSLMVAAPSFLSSATACSRSSRTKTSALLSFRWE